MDSASATLLSRPVTILVPAYGAAEKLQVCLRSLARHLPLVGCQVIVLDDATPDDSVRQAYEACSSEERLHLIYQRSAANQGFVKTCNWGAKQWFEQPGDLLLLNSDTEATGPFLCEMQQLLDLHEKHAVVTPRSNCATIFSVPFTGPSLPAQESYAIWQRLHPFLPRYSTMPTAVGFCMLIKGEVLMRFPLFDEIYSPGYNEENDFVCRINRYGYSALAANRTFVFHHESSTFGERRAALEEKNSAILQSRYPEYSKKVGDFFRFYVDPLEHFAMLFGPHKPRLLFDLYHLPPAHNGTSEFALNLLRTVEHRLEAEFDIVVGIGSAMSAFESELSGYNILSEEEAATTFTRFDLAFKPAQFFRWSDFERLNQLALRVSFTLQDIIGVRCEYLNSPYRQLLFSKTAELSDHIFTISSFSCDDVNAFYGSDYPMEVIHHGTDLEVASPIRSGEEYVLVVGNHYVHKGVEDALDRLGARYPVRTLGGTTIMPERPNVKRLKSGHLTRQYVRQLFAQARVVVYPSHYEGFGLPVLDSVGLRKPVIALDTAVNRELMQMIGSERLQLLPHLDDLAAVVDKAWLTNDDSSPNRKLRSWDDVAEEYVNAFRRVAAKPIDARHLRNRWQFLRTLQSLPIEAEA